MDYRISLLQGETLSFPGMDCIVGRLVGRGSNAMVYEGTYQDSLSNVAHRVLIKELFPYDPEGRILRDEAMCIRCEPEAQELWDLHRRSFERGNRVHLELLQRQPDSVGGNLNTFARNGTLYSVLDYSGGRSVENEISGKPLPPLSQTVGRMLSLLDVLEIFHDNGFLHLDISPDNILLIGSGNLERVSLIDFNSVHTPQELRGAAQVYFSAKEGYTAPEVRARSIAKIGPGTDLFSVTAVFYFCLTGETLTNVQLNSKAPPDVENRPLLSGIPCTAAAQVRKILQRGLHVLPKARYQSCEEMRRDLVELQNRLNCQGVTHAALWEAGRRSIERLVKTNPSLDYVKQTAALYPLAVSDGESGVQPSDGFMEDCAAQGKSVLILGEGGIGKSTVLLRTALSVPRRYTELSVATLYIPLANWREGSGNNILDQLLMELRFDPQTNTMEAARQALFQMLANPYTRRDGRRSMVRILLDGLNEARGNTAALLEEINRLAVLPGVCIVVTGRTEEEGLLLPRAEMVRLTEETVGETLGKQGLLLPEEDSVRELLRIPMMLNLYLSTAREKGQQLQCRSAEELLEEYLNALCAKMSDSENAHFRGEAAVWLLLPAIAREIAQKGRTLSDAELQKVVHRCYGVFRSKRLTKAFPQWIGHKKEILSEDEDAWHGEMVQQLLWKQLGLLLVENGQYRLPHQILQDYLEKIAAENEKKLRARQRRAAAGFCASTLVLLTGLFMIYYFFFRPVPYTEQNALPVFSAAANYYASAIQATKALDAFLESDGGEMALRSCKSLVQVSTKAVGSIEIRRLERLEAERADGATVLPWSGNVFDLESCKVLLALPASLAENALSNPGYFEIMEAFHALSTSPLGEINGVEQEAFRASVREMLAAQQKYAWTLFQAVCVPHEKRLPEQAAQSYPFALASVGTLLFSQDPGEEQRDLAEALELCRREMTSATGEVNKMVKTVIGYETGGK